MIWIGPAAGLVAAAASQQLHSSLPAQIVMSP
jgi:hypothetical protein